MTPTLPAVAIIERRADGAIVVTPARFLTPERLRAEQQAMQAHAEGPPNPRYDAFRAKRSNENDQAIAGLRIDPTQSGERRIDRFARLLAHIRRTHPTTAHLIWQEHAHTPNGRWWLGHYLPQLEREWAAGVGRAATTKGEGE